MSQPQPMFSEENSLHRPLVSTVADRSTGATIDWRAGDEYLFTPPQLHERMSALKRKGSFIPRDKMVNACGVTAFAFTLNYIFGAGVLSLPLTMSRAGIIGSAVFMMFTAFLSSVSMIWLTEVCGRGEAITREGEEDLIQSPPVPYIASRAENQGESLFRISSRRLEVNQLSSLFLGPWMGRIYSASVTLYSLASMWFYAAIFSRSLTETIPLMNASHCDLANVELSELDPPCHNTYFVYLAVFLGLTMVASLFDLADQKKLQTSLSVLAMSCLCVMLTTLIVEAARHPYENGNGASPAPAPAPAPAALAVDLAPEPRPGYEPVPLGLNVKAFGAAFMNFIFAFMAHHGVPGLLQLMENKRGAPKTFISAMSAACAVYLCLGIVAASYFGRDPSHGIKSLVTLNWDNFNGDMDPSDPGSTFTKAISFLIRLYPCVSVSSAFVLYADTLANSLRMALGGRCVKSGRCLKILTRWIVIWLSIIGAALMIKISVIVSVCGIIGVNLVMIFPALLQIYSSQLCEQRFGRSRTLYSWHFSNLTYARLMLGFAALSVAVGMYALITSLVEV